MYTFLNHFHSGWRWVLLLLLVIAIVNNFRKWRQGGSFTASDLKRNLYAMAAVHLQFLTGLILYLISPKVQFGAGVMKDSYLRFYVVEHSVMMVIALVLITIGFSKSKRADNDIAKFRLGFRFYFWGLLVILAGIPWPWRTALGGGWF